MGIIDTHTSRDAGTSGHAWTGIDFNEPRFHVFREHVVRSVEFKAIFLCFRYILRGEEDSHDPFLHSWVNHLVPQV